MPRSLFIATASNCTFAPVHLALWYSSTPTHSSKSMSKALLKPLWVRALSYWAPSSGRSLEASAPLVGCWITSRRGQRSPSFAHILIPCHRVKLLSFHRGIQSPSLMTRSTGVVILILMFLADWSHITWSGLESVKVWTVDNIHNGSNVSYNYRSKRGIYWSWVINNRRK